MISAALVKSLDSMEGSAASFEVRDEIIYITLVVDMYTYACMHESVCAVLKHHNASSVTQTVQMTCSVQHI